MIYDRVGFNYKTGENYLYQIVSLPMQALVVVYIIKVMFSFLRFFQKFELPK